jgi:hypothetical protein
MSARSLLVLALIAIPVVARGDTAAARAPEPPRSSLLGNVRGVMEWGAIGDGVADDTGAFLAALAASDAVFVPPGRYRLRSTLVLPAGKNLFGVAARSTVLLADVGAAPLLFLAGNEARASNINIAPYVAPDSRASVHRYVGVKINADFCTIENVAVSAADTAFLLTSDAQHESHFNTLLNVIAEDFGSYGIRLMNEGAGSHGNTIIFKYLYGHRPAGRESVGISVEGGTGVNNFIGGEISRCTWPAIFDGVNNRLLGAYIESVEHGIWNRSGVNYVESHIATTAVSRVDEGALIGPGGMQVSAYSQLNQQARLSARGLQAMWLFDEGGGSMIRDVSGHGRHLEHTRPGDAWRGAHPAFGVAVDASEGLRLTAVPSAAVDVTQPFTIAVWARIDDLAGRGGAPIIASLHDGHRYVRIVARAPGLEFDDYDGVQFRRFLGGGMTYEPGHEAWVFYAMAFNKEARTARYYSVQEGRVVEMPPKDVTLAALSASTTIQLMASEDRSLGPKGRIAFAALWQRELAFSEVLDLANWRLPGGISPLRGVMSGAELVSRSGASSTETLGHGPPTTGTWRRGDRVRNEAPVELGPTGARYIVDGWRCVEGGAPGAWVEARVLTGR